MITCLSLVREETGDEGTFGRLSIPGGEVLKTGELPWRNNATGISCIPTGRYRCLFTKSEHFPGGTFQIIGVPGRTGVRIHKANWCGDPAKGFAWDIEGCVAVGIIKGTQSNQVWMDKHKPGTKGFMQKGVFRSTEAFGLLMARMGLLPFDLEITEEYGT